MLQSNVPSLTVSDTGVVIPDTPSILAGFLLDFKTAFGQDLNISSLSTPQGYLSQELTYLLTQLNEAISQIYAGVDPATASGRMQDAIGRIYFLSRQPATATVVEAICTGTPYAILPAGSQAKDDAGNLYASTGQAFFDANGQATVNFQCLTTGAIPCGIGELSRIAVAVSGWDAVTNTSPGVVGTATENRSAFERRRSQSVAINANSTTQTIYANVASLLGVIDAVVVDNPTGESTTFGETDYTLVPHSVLVSVEGGNDQQIANTIWTKKPPGCNYNGNTTLTVEDDAYLTNNKPSYHVTFLRPTHTTVLFDIQIEDDDKLPSDIITQVKQRVIDLFNGNWNDQDRERINGTIYASRYYVAIQDIAENINILSILIGLQTANLTFLTMGIDQFPVVDENSITVTLV